MNRNFIIGDKQLHNGVPNCPLFKEAYNIAIIYNHRETRWLNPATLLWNSESIHMDGSLKLQIDPKMWAIPLAITLGLVFAVIFYCSRRR